MAEPMLVSPTHALMQQDSGRIVWLIFWKFCTHLIPDGNKIVNWSISLANWLKKYTKYASGLLWQFVYRLVEQS